jgi:hypothetical protein
MPAPRLQEAVCYLSFLHATPLAGSPYVGHAGLLEWIGAALTYWCGLQHPDGSFDEAYPFERSLAATAFSSFYVAEAIALLGEDLPSDVRDAVLGTLRRAALWLCRNDETHGILSNHLAAAAAAAYHAYRLLDERAFAERSRHFLERVLGHQSPEGWYEEYGGPDPGYQTHGSFYLVRLWELSRDRDLEASLKRAMAFLAECIHPDASIGGEYASRNTKTYYPAAFEMFATSDAAAAWIATTMRRAVAEGTAAGLQSIDTFNYFPFLNNLVFAHRAAANPGRSVRPPDLPVADGLRWFPHAGLAIVRRPAYTAYVGTAKGGVLQVFDRRAGRLVLSDCGYVGWTVSGIMASTQYLDRNREVTVAEDRIQVDGEVMTVSRPVMRPLRFLGFRIFSLSVGRWAPVGRWLKRLLVRVLIYRRRSLRIAFHRVVEFADDVVRVRDVIGGPDGARLTELRRAAVFSTVHMGSARYFVPNELDVEYGAEPVLTGDRIVGGATVERSLRMTEGT